MSISRIADRYAKSLLDLAIENNSTEVVLGDMKAFQELLKNRDLQLLIKSPIVNTSQKESVFKAMFEGKADKLTMAFFNIILKKGREVYLPEICNDFIKQYKKMKGITDVTVTTATAMTPELLEDLKAKLLNSDATDSSVAITSKVDPDLIGGFVVEIGDRLYDNSISHKLNEMKKQFASKK